LTSCIHYVLVLFLGFVSGWFMLAHRADQSWQDALVARYPRLFVSGDNQAGIPGYPLVGDGWRDLVERAAGRIANVLAAAPSAP
jgi:hypothetical protein